MSVVDGGGPVPAGLVQRVQDILLRPDPTWDKIDTEPATIGGLYRNYVLILAAIPAVATLIGGLVFGYGAFGLTWRPNPVNLVVTAVVGYALSLAMVYVMALIIDALAPSFGGAKNQIQAFKVAAYFPTAAWLGGVLGIVPALAVIGSLIGLYSLFLLYKGLPKLMKAPEDKALGYTAVVVVLAIVASIIMGAITGAVTAAGRMGPLASASDGRLEGKLGLPGGGSVDLGNLEEKMRRAEAIANGTAKVELVSTDKLRELLPGSVRGFNRGEITTESGQAGGFGASTAKADYTKGDATMTVEVVDTSAGGLVGMAAAFSMESSRESGGTYERVKKVGGRMTMEKYDRDARTGEYGVLVGDRIMVSATGSNVSMDDLKAAVASVDLGRVERLAR